MEPLEILNKIIIELELKQLYQAKQIVDKAVLRLEQKLEITEMDRARLMHEVLTRNTIENGK